ncbi:hypothetical protein FACS1894187_05400 [Synergistales bacterium]|nr:hypothetical protein FACS1894187_05400 [Synergistales bacterium]
MTTTQIAERETLYRRILELPDEEFAHVSQYVDNLEGHKPNKETARAMRDIQDQHDLVAFDSIDEMFAALKEEVEQEKYATA